MYKKDNVHVPMVEDITTGVPFWLILRLVENGALASTY